MDAQDPPSAPHDAEPQDDKLHVDSPRANAATTATIALRVLALYLFVRGIEWVVQFWPFSEQPGANSYRVAAFIGPVGGALIWITAPRLGRTLAKSESSDRAHDDATAGSWDPVSALRVAFAVAGAFFVVRGITLVLQEIGALRTPLVTYPGSRASDQFSRQALWLMVAGVFETVAGCALMFGTSRLAHAVHRMRYGDEPTDEDEDGEVS